MIHYENTQSKTWLELPWKEFQRNTYRLQKRIYKASQKNDIATVLKLQRLMLISYETRMLAIRQVTQLNQARKKISGIDKKTELTNCELFALEKALSLNVKNWKPQPLQKKPLTLHLRFKGKTLKKRNQFLANKRGQSSLNITTLKDRVWQCLIKMIIEPAHEATFHERSYGFRPGRSPHDVQKLLCLNLSRNAQGKTKRVLLFRIDNFDQINSETILNKIIAPRSIKIGLHRCFKVGQQLGYPEPLPLENSYTSTNQEGLSSLLANIALNGIEKIHPSIRYADHMLLLLKPEDKENTILPLISTFLTERGMNISQKFIKIIAATNGFDFLDWHFKVLKDGRLKSTPSHENFRTFKKKIKAVVNNSAFGATEKSELLAPIVKGWRNYHKFCNMTKHSLWHLNHRAWIVFNKQPKLSRYDVNLLVKKAFPAISFSETKRLNAVGKKSPYDGDIFYWSKRERQL